MKRCKRLFINILIVSRLVLTPVGAQSVVQLNPEDSLIHQNLDEIVVTDDPITGSYDPDRITYSENINQVIENQSGIGLTRRGNYASEVVRRGMNSDRIGVTIDGMKIFSACTDRMDPVTSYIAANNLETMSCASDGEGKCFSSNIGGQVNFNTKEPRLNDPKIFRGNASLGANSASAGKQFSLNTNFSQKNWAVRLNGMYTTHENYRAGGGEIIPFSQYNKTNFGASAKLKLGKHDYLLADYIHDYAWNVGYPALPMDVAFARADIYSLTYRNYFTRLKGKMTFKVYGNNIVHEMDDSKREVLMHMDMPGLSDTYGTYFLTEIDAFEKHEIRINIDGYYNRAFADMTMHPEGERQMYMVTWPDVHRMTGGIFIRDNWNFAERLYLNVSGRIDLSRTQATDETGIKLFRIFHYDIDRPYDLVLPSAGLEVQRDLKNDASLTLGVNYAERLPTVSEQFSYYIFNSQDGYNYIGNPDILNETSWKGEIGYAETKRKFSYSGKLYSYYIENYILGKVAPEEDGINPMSNGVKHYTNLPYATISGAEVEFSAGLTSWLKISTGFTYAYGADNEGNGLPLISPLKNNTRLKASYKSHRIETALTSAMAQNRYSSNAGENATPGYMILNISYRKVFSFKDQGVHLIAGVDNVFDTAYHDHLDWNDIPRQGRNVYIKVRYLFN